MGNTMPDTIEEDAQYSELYAKWAPRVAGKQQAMVTQMGEDATAGIGSYPVPPMEDAPREEPLLQQATPATTEAIANLLAWNAWINIAYADAVRAWGLTKNTWTWGTEPCVKSHACAILTPMGHRVMGEL